MRTDHYPASQIKQQTDKNGKAVFYINFDTDKAMLRPDGRKAVDEIVKLLNETPSLNLSIEGHTDDTGDANYINNSQSKGPGR